MNRIPLFLFAAAVLLACLPNAGGATTLPDAGTFATAGPVTDTTPPILVNIFGTEGSSGISVTFNEDMGNGVTDALNYSLTRSGNPIAIVSVDRVLPFRVRITLAQTLPGGTYALSVTRVEDESGNPIEDVTRPFTIETVLLRLPSAEYMAASNTILLTFDEAVGAGGESLSNYEMFRLSDPTDRIEITHTAVSAHTVTVSLGTVPLEASWYAVRVDHLLDIHGEPFGRHVAALFTTPATGGAPTLVSTDYDDGSRRVTLGFSEAVGAGAGIPASYEVFPISQPIQRVNHSIAGVQDRFVVLQLAYALPWEEDFGIRVNDVENLAGNRIATDSEIWFRTSDVDTHPPLVISAVHNSDASLLALGFSETLRHDAGDASNFEVFPTANPSQPLGFTVSGAEGVIVHLLLADRAEPGVEHTVRVNHVQDPSGNAIAPDSEIRFTPRIDTDPPTVLDVAATAGINRVEVLFSEAMGNNLDNPASYSLMEETTPLSITGAESLQPNRVRLTLSRALQAKAHSLTITGVEDLAGNPFAGLPIALDITSRPTGGPASPVVALHVQERLSNKGVNPCATAPAMSCEDFVVQGEIATSYDLYVILVGRNDPEGTLAGAAFGVNYGGGVQVNQWVSCADLEFPGNDWPESDGGNLVTFDAVNNCQTDLHGSDVHAALGVFYVYAYAADSFTITPRLYLTTPDLTAMDCTSAQSTVNYPEETATVGFGLSGYNPCSGSGRGTPVKPTTWGNIKLQFSDEGDVREEP